ncbi:MAG: ISH3 family transposase, partial [Halobacteriaceae archaeon]
KRFGIEASYRLSEQSIATTSTRSPVIRLLFVVVSLALQNAWRYLCWEFVSVPRQGARQLLDWPFGEFLAMLTRAVWTVLRVRRSVPSNKPPDERFE